MNDKKAELITTEDIDVITQHETIQAMMRILGVDVSCPQINSLCGKQSFEVNDVAEKVTIRGMQAYHSIINSATKSVISWDSNDLKKLTESLDLFPHFDGFFHEENLVRECQLLMPTPVQSSDFLENIVLPVQRFILNRAYLSNQALGMSLCLMLLAILKARSGACIKEINFAPFIYSVFASYGDLNNLSALFMQAENTLSSSPQGAREQDCAGNDTSAKYLDVEVTNEL